MGAELTSYFFTYRCNYFVMLGKIEGTVSGVEKQVGLIIWQFIYMALNSEEKYTLGDRKSSCYREVLTRGCCFTLATNVVLVSTWES